MIQYLKYPPISLFDDSIRFFFLFVLMKINCSFQNWSLKILRITAGDAGVYRCQANSHPPKFITVRLDVVGKHNKYIIIK